MDQSRGLLAEGDLCGLLKQRLEDAMHLVNRICTLEGETKELRQFLRSAEERIPGYKAPRGSAADMTAPNVPNGVPSHIGVQPSEKPRKTSRTVGIGGEASAKSRVKKSRARPDAEMHKTGLAADAGRQSKKPKQSRHVDESLAESGKRAAGKIRKTDPTSSSHEEPPAAGRGHSKKKKNRSETLKSKMDGLDQATGVVNCIERLDAQAGVQGCGEGRISKKKKNRSETLKSKMDDLDQAAGVVNCIQRLDGQVGVEGCGEGRISKKKKNRSEALKSKMDDLDQAIGVVNCIERLDAQAGVEGCGEGRISKKKKNRSEALKSKMDDLDQATGVGSCIERLDAQAGVEGCGEGRISKKKKNRSEALKSKMDDLDQATGVVSRIERPGAQAGVEGCGEGISPGAGSGGVGGTAVVKASKKAAKFSVLAGGQNRMDDLSERKSDAPESPKLRVESGGPAKKAAKSKALPGKRNRVDDLSEGKFDAPGSSKLRVESGSGGGGGVQGLSGEDDGIRHDKTSAGETSQRAAKLATPRKRQPVDLIVDVNTRPTIAEVSFLPSRYVDARHSRKLRTLVLNPADANQCATSGLDGIINIWQIGKSFSPELGISAVCRSPATHHWPEDVAWHPDGHSLFSVYTSDRGDSQVSVLKNNGEHESAEFISEKPHVKGLLNGIAFLPWSSSLFVTGGADHAVHLWRQDDAIWKAGRLHDSIHSSLVSGVAGTYHKDLVVSAGLDKKVIGFDPAAGATAFRIELVEKALKVRPNPVDFNLLMVQTGNIGKQLGLWDMRTTKKQVHCFGWNPDSSQALSALIDQSWSPNGYCIVSGTVDPRIPLFDIRYNRKEPAQIITAHTHRVYKAIWHPSLPIIFSISADRRIGIHTIDRH